MGEGDHVTEHFASAKVSGEGWGGGGWGLKLPLPVSSTPSSRDFYSRFSPLSVVVPSSLSHFSCEI